MAKSAKPVSIDAIELNSTQAAKLLGITQQYFNQLVRDEWIKPVGKNRYRLPSVVQGYKAFLQDEGRRTQKSAAASRVQDARASQLELQNARELGKLIEIEDVLLWQSEILGRLRTELTGVPAASSRDLDVRAEIEKQVNAAIERCRRSFEEAWQAIESGKPVTLGGEEADA
jgi:hypothetical protein